MRNLDPVNYTALQQRRLVARDFLRIVAHDRLTGAEVIDDMWSDHENVSAQVIDPNTNLPVTRVFSGVNELVQISDIPLVSTLSVQNVTIQLSQVVDRVNELVRTYDCRQAHVEIHRGLFSPETRLMVAPAECRFVGFVDEINILTPEEGGDGHVELVCASYTQEMTRANSDTRSEASQQNRLLNDAFFRDAATVGEWDLSWGKKKGKVDAKTTPASVFDFLGKS